MSNEIQYRHNATGDTIYVVLIAPTSLWLNINDSAYEVFDKAKWTEYASSVPELDDYWYLTDFPSWVTVAGAYGAIFFKQLGGSPTITDPILRPDGILGWDGTQEIDITDIDTIVTWLKNVAEGDAKADISDATQYQVVTQIKSTSTDLIRKDLKDAGGLPIVTLNTIIGQQVEPTP